MAEKSLFTERVSFYINHKLIYRYERRSLIRSLRAVGSFFTSEMVSGNFFVSKSRNTLSYFQVSPLRQQVRRYVHHFNFPFWHSRRASLPSSRPLASSSSPDSQLKKTRTENVVSSKKSSCAPESLTAVNPYGCFTPEKLLMRLLQKVSSCIRPLEQEAYLSVKIIFLVLNERAVCLRGSFLGL